MVPEAQDQPQREGSTMEAQVVSKTCGAKIGPELVGRIDGFAEVEDEGRGN